jgi:5'-3' exoribonuclease 2
MFNNIFEYTNKLIKILKPQKLIYLAIDGVAPRAKMNQQRSRRFRAALEATTRQEKEEELLHEWESKGLKAPNMPKEKGFDSNVITPGTKFMSNLSEVIKLFISSNLQDNPLWKGLTVILSDSSVPGEGEHKILEFIRVQRLQEHYNPNTKHCIYGADADLIMLSLITHEPHFYIIRESLNENIWKKCEMCGKNGHVREDCIKFNKDEGASVNILDNVEFSLMKVHVVREYLELEFKGLKLPFEYDFERLIDDFVFLCFFVGNDFLPHLPSLKIREGAIDALLYLYKKIIPDLDGYLTEGNGMINLARTQVLLEKLAKIENAVFENQLRFKNRDNRQQGNQVKDQAYTDFKNIGKTTELNSEEIKIGEDVFNDIETIIDKHENAAGCSEETDDRVQRLNEQANENFKRIFKEHLRVKYYI